jgi:hypothetical protein
MAMKLNALDLFPSSPGVCGRICDSHQQKSVISINDIADVRNTRLDIISQVQYMRLVQLRPDCDQGKSWCDRSYLSLKLEAWAEAKYWPMIYHRPRASIEHICDPEMDALYQQLSGSDSKGALTCFMSHFGVATLFNNYCPTPFRWAPRYGKLSKAITWLMLNRFGFSALWFGNSERITPDVSSRLKAPTHGERVSLWVAQWFRFTSFTGLCASCSGHCVPLALFLIKSSDPRAE